jgi:hypothetical protein
LVGARRIFIYGCYGRGLRAVQCGVSAKRRVPAATWSSVWYLLSAFAVITYTKNWMYVVFAASGSWVAAYISMTLLRRPKDIAGPMDMHR